MTAATTLPPPPPASPAPPAPPAPPARSGSRTAAIAVASVMGALSLAAFALGGVALWGDAQRDDDGYISTATHRYTASTAALTTEEIDVDADIPGWVGGNDAVYGKMRMRVESRDGGPVFAGIARTSDVERYLAGASRTVVTDIDTDPFDVEYAAHEGGTRPAAPAGEDIWVATAEGAGRRTLDWDVREGRWSVVVMNSDGSRGVDADVSAGVRVAFLGTLGWSLLGGGMVLLLGAAGVAYAGLRRR
jgi:hypothetical protein